MYGGVRLYAEFSKFYDDVMGHMEYEKWMELLEYEFNGDVKKVLDLGCGTGELSYRLVEKGYEVVGLDYSEEMLSIAEQKLYSKNIKIPLYSGDMRTFETGETYDAIISVFDTVNHLLSLEEFEQMLVQVGEHLEKDGLFVFDLATRELMDNMFKDEIFADDREGLTILWQHWVDEETELDNVVISFFVEIEENTYKRVDEHYEKKIFNEADLITLIHKKGFQIVNKFTSDEIAGNRVIYSLKKR